jgi:hypothetical protein
MLSRAEISFFRGEKQISEDYARKIRARAEAKIQRLHGELAILALDPKIGPIVRKALEDDTRTENCPSKSEDSTGPAVSAPKWVRVYDQEGDSLHFVSIFAIVLIAWKGQRSGSTPTWIGDSDEEASISSS